MNFLILLALVVLNYQMYKLSNLLITIDQQKLDVGSEDLPSANKKQRG